MPPIENKFLKGSDKIGGIIRKRKRKTSNTSFLDMAHSVWRAKDRYIHCLPDADEFPLMFDSYWEITVGNTIQSIMK